MTLPTHRVSYQVEYGILDKALNDELGARVKMPTWEAANHLRSRVHQARKIDRVQNTDAYPEGHQMHGQSIYDKLVCRIKQHKGYHYLYIEQRSAEDLTVERLSADEPQVNHEEEPAPMEVHEVVVVETSLKRKWS